MAVGSDSGGAFLKSGAINVKAGIYICALIAGLAGLGTSSARAVTVDVFAQANSSAGALTGVFLTGLTICGAQERLRAGQMPID